MFLIIIIIPSAYTYHGKKKNAIETFIFGRQEAKIKGIILCIGMWFIFEFNNFFEIKTCFESYKIKTGENEPAHLWT